MKRLLLSPIFALVVLLAGCSSDTPQIQPLSSDAVILAFGDSLTFGTGASPDSSYPAVLSQLLGRQVINAGVPGELSSQGLQRLPELLEQTRPDLVILVHGGNDLLRNQSRQQLEQNLSQMIGVIRQHGAQVIMASVPAPGIRLSPAAEYQRVSAQYDLPLENQIISQLLRDPSMKADPIHPNADGYHKLATALWQLLKDSGAIF